MVVLIIPWGHLNLTSNRVPAAQRSITAIVSITLDPTTLYKISYHFYASDDPFEPCLPNNVGACACVSSIVARAVLQLVWILLGLPHNSGFSFFWSKNFVFVHQQIPLAGLPFVRNLMGLYMTVTIQNVIVISFLLT